MLQGGRIHTAIPLEGCMTKEPLGDIYFLFFSVFLYISYDVTENIIRNYG